MQRTYYDMDYSEDDDTEYDYAPAYSDEDEYQFHRCILCPRTRNYQLNLSDENSNYAKTNP